MNISNTNEHFFPILYTCINYYPPMNPVKFRLDQIQNGRLISTFVCSNWQNIWKPTTYHLSAIYVVLKIFSQKHSVVWMTLMGHVYHIFHNLNVNIDDHCNTYNDKDTFFMTIMSSVRHPHKEWMWTMSSVRHPHKKWIYEYWTIEILPNKDKIHVSILLQLFSPTKFFFFMGDNNLGSVRPAVRPAVRLSGRPRFVHQIFFQ